MLMIDKISRAHTAAVTPPGESSLAAEIGILIPALNRFARLLYRDDEAAADLTQETLAKAWKARGSFAPGTNLRAWLLAIMRNQFRSEVRRAWRQVPWDEGAAETISAPPYQQLWSIELDDAARAVDALPARQRDALILAGVGGYSTEEVAAMLHCRPTAVKSRVSRARRAVQAAVEGTRQNKKLRRCQAASIADIIDRMQRLTASPAEHARAAAA
jgi:RNA polymerase sigma-70 factor, ECF subfamily